MSRHSCGQNTEVPFRAGLSPLEGLRAHRARASHLRELMLMKPVASTARSLPAHSCQTRVELTKHPGDPSLTDTQVFSCASNPPALWLPHCFPSGSGALPRVPGLESREPQPCHADGRAGSRPCQCQLGELLPPTRALHLYLRTRHVGATSALRGVREERRCPAV